jgi:hypothetical protein
MGSTDSAGTSAALAQSKAAYNKYTGEYDKWGNQYNQYRQQADQAWQNDFGANAADFTKKQNRAGIQQANQLLDAQSRGAAAQAQKASRSAGLGKGQAALNAADITNQTFQAGYAPAVQTGRENYAGAAAANQSQLQNRMGNSIGLMGTAANQATTATGQTAQIGAQQMSDWDRNWGIASGVGGMVSGVGSMIGSDRRLKDVRSGTIDYGPYLERARKLLERSHGK